jgi:hypothetical protein
VYVCVCLCACVWERTGERVCGYACGVMGVAVPSSPQPRPEFWRGSTTTLSRVSAWSDEKLAYLKAREVEIKDFEVNHYLDVQTVEAARFQLLLLRSLRHRQLRLQ